MHFLKQNKNMHACSKTMFKTTSDIVNDNILFKNILLNIKAYLFKSIYIYIKNALVAKCYTPYNMYNNII